MKKRYLILLTALNFIFTQSPFSQALVGGNFQNQKLAKNFFKLKSTPFVCGSSLLEGNKILTAAHCLYDKKNNVVLKRGSQLILEQNVNGSDKLNIKVTIENVYIHPSFVKNTKKTGSVAKATLDNSVFDIAIIKIKKDQNLENILPIKDPDKGILLISGAGSENTKQQGEQKDSNLKFGNLSYLKDEGTIGFAFNDLAEKISLSEGDSGSPIYQDNHIVGVARAVPEADEKGQTKFSAFSKLDINWIQSLK